MAGAAVPGGLTTAPRPARLEWKVASVVARRRETPRVLTIVLEIPDWPGHRAGQHLDVRLTAEDGYQAQRSYSIASAPGAPHVEISVERLDDGEVSSYLTDVLREGDPLELRGPIGGYFVWDPAVRRPLALVAGGSGIVPLMSMIRHRAALAAASDSVPPARLLFSARVAEELIYRSELDRMAAADADVRVAYTLTRSQPDGWAGYGRRIDAAMLREVFDEIHGSAVLYVCGPTPMVESAARLLVDLGHDPLDVRTERFGPTGGGA